MTILEELTDVAFKSCENGRNSGQKHMARGAALLSSTGKVYSGCDVYVDNAGTRYQEISAEKASLLAAVADGCPKVDVILFFIFTVFILPIILIVVSCFYLHYFPVVHCNCLGHNGVISNT